MKTIEISYNKWNYLKDDGTYLLDRHVKFCYDFIEFFGIVQYNDNTYNFVNSKGKLLLKNNVDDSYNFYNGFAPIKINLYWYYIDKECNFYTYEDKVSFKELYKKYPNMRSLLIEKYTYFNVNEYFNI